MPWIPPIDPDYCRGNAWCVPMPGAPMVEGVSSSHPERILSWFIDRYEEKFQRDYLTKYAQRSYTHLTLSWDDSSAPVNCAIPGVRPGGAGQTLDQFVGTCKRVKEYIPRVQVILGSKDYAPHNMTFEEYKARYEPVLDRLLAEGCVDEVCPAWEMNLWNVPGATTIAICKWVGQKCHPFGVTVWLHFSTEYTSWFADGDPRGRFGFWQDLGNDVDGLNYQAGSDWTPDMLQARLVDTLWQFGTEGNRHKIRLWENRASLQFDNDHPDEDDGDLSDYLGCCAIDNVRWTDAKVWGYNNGGRYPDGAAL